MDEINEGGFVREWWRNLVTSPAFEDEACVGAVDTNLFHVRVRKVLRQRAKRRHCSKGPAQQLLGLFLTHRRHGSSLLVADHAPDEVMDPELIVDTYAREIAPCQLGGELGLDARTHLKLDGGALAAGYCHLETAEPISG
jgi:hypothetical protein